MRVQASVKKICRNCKLVRRKGVLRVICTDKRHKQRQGIGKVEKDHHGSYCWR